MNLLKKIFLLIIMSNLSLNVFSLDKTRNYSNTLQFINNLNSNFKVITIDNIQYNDEKYPVYKITYNPCVNQKSKKYLIISGVHGNEPAPVYAVRDFILSLNKKDVKRKDLQIDFILIANPYGFEFNQRYNGDNLDINRDLIQVKSQEIKILSKNFKPKDYDKVFDFHEANSEGFFLYCYGKKNEKLSNSILKELEKSEIIFDNKYKDKILEVKDGKLYVPWYASLYMRMNKTVTNGIYYSNCKNSFTFETSKNMKIEERKRVIEIILNYIIENV